MSDTRTALVAIVGRPNVGKSTLLNALVGEKVSIVTPKPQTTRHRIVGLRTDGDTQIAFVDTPGIHDRAKSALNRMMNRTAVAAIEGVDLVLFVCEAGRWLDEDDLVLRRLARSRAPVGLVVNKVDNVKPRSRLLPFLEELNTKREFAFGVPLSATKKDNLPALERELAARLHPGPFFYEPDQLSDRSQRFMVSELVREKLMLALQQELPYSISVEVEQYQEQNGVLHIAAIIWVARDGQKAIVVGKGGSVLKRVGTQARKELELRLEQKVFLELWVKVKEGWADDERMLRSLGYDAGG